jgi:hypothetical protein
MADIDVLSNDSQTDIFFRAVDRLQLESFIGALNHDHKSLVIVSPYPELLQYYGDVVIRRLHKKFANVPMEVVVADDTDAILERFNVILSDLSFEEATKSRDLSHPEKILVIQDAKKLGVHNLELLVRLIQNFPGAGICALLLFETSNVQTTHIFRDNNRFMTWALELPTADQKRNTFEAAKKTGQEDIVTNFFAQLSQAEKTVAPKISTHPISSGADQQRKVPSKTEKQATALWPKLIIGFGLLTVTLGVTAVLHPEISHNLLTAFKSKAKAPVVEAKSSPKVEAPDTLEPEVVITELPAQATQGLNWVLNLHPDQYVLEYKTFEKIADAQAYVNSKASLKQAHIVPVMLENQAEASFMVVEGPHRSAEAARFAANRSSMIGDITIEKVSSLIEFSDLKKLKPSKPS